MPNIATMLSDKLSFLDDKILSKRILWVCVCILFAWCLCLARIHKSHEALISSSRLIVETIIVFSLFRLNAEKTSQIVLSVVTIIATLNSLVVVVQMCESAGCLPTSFNSLITSVWRLPVNEWTRKSGFFNGFQTSSFFSFMALVILVRRRDGVSSIFAALNIFPIFFGARTFLLFLPFVMVLSRKLIFFVFMLFSLIFSFAHVEGCNKQGLLPLMKTHLNERVIPAFFVAIKADVRSDYSAKDTMSHYKNSLNGMQWLWGNGMPRYSKEGGGDPAFSRWLSQAGIPGALLVILISLCLIVRIAKKNNTENIFFALVLVLSTIKGELVTAALVYSTLLVYALSTSSSVLPVWERKGGGAV